jgi:hypothetical protein
MDEDDAVGEVACTCLAVAAACMYAFAPHVRLDFMMGAPIVVDSSFFFSRFSRLNASMGFTWSAMTGDNGPEPRETGEHSNQQILVNFGAPTNRARGLDPN